MATTTNYSWTTPDDTDLVKDGAAAIRTLGTAIDTTVFTNAGAAIAKSLVDAKGDIIAATADNTVDRLAVGANDTVLTADSSTSTGLKWAAASAAGANWSLLNAGGTTLSGSQTVTVSGISAIDKILVLLGGASAVSANTTVGVQFNTDTGNNYYRYGFRGKFPTTYSANEFQAYGSATNQITLGGFSTNADSTASGFLLMSGCNSSGVKAFNSAGTADTGGGGAGGQQSFIFGGYYDSASTISSVSIFCSSGNFDGGTVYVYTSA